MANGRMCLWGIATGGGARYLRVETSFIEPSAEHRSNAQQPPANANFDVFRMGAAAQNQSHKYLK